MTTKQAVKKTVVDLVVEDAETLLRIIGKRGLYPTEDDWELIANCANALRATLASYQRKQQDRQPSEQAGE